MNSGPAGSIFAASNLPICMYKDRVSRPVKKPLKMIPFQDLGFRFKYCQFLMNMAVNCFQLLLYLSFAKSLKVTFKLANLSLSLYILSRTVGSWFFW